MSMRDSEMARETMSILGFSPPSFTYGTDLILPVSANAELRQLLVSDLDLNGATDVDDVAVAEIAQYPRLYVPQV